MKIFVSMLTAAFMALIDGMLLMFVLPFLHIQHYGYWECVFIAYVFTAIVSSPVYQGVKVAHDMRDSK